MENNRHSRKVLWIVLITLVVVIITLALIIRNEKRLLRLAGKLDKRLHFRKPHNVPIKVDF